MIDPQWIIKLRDKEYPVWAGVLDAATRAGLRSLKTRVLQVPCPDNGNLAVVEATAVFEDGREFTDVGDCSPASTSANLAAAALRLASTRAKGRVLRDSVNVGQTMWEELPDGGLPDEERREGNGHSRPAPAPEARPAPAPVASRVDPAGVCAWPGCETFLNKNQVTLSKHHADRPLCPDHLAAFRKEKEAAAAK